MNPDQGYEDGLAGRPAKDGTRIVNGEEGWIAGYDGYVRGYREGQAARQTASEKPHPTNGRTTTSPSNSGTETSANERQSSPSRGRLKWWILFILYVLSVVGMVNSPDPDPDLAGTLVGLTGFFLFLAALIAVSGPLLRYLRRSLSYGYSCSGCGRSVAMGMKSCPHCGIKFKETGDENTRNDARGSREESQDLVQVYSCSDCGRSVTPDLKFCPHCGIKFNWVSDEDPRKRTFAKAASDAVGLMALRSIYRNYWR